MKKIAIITLTGYFNYGNRLQNYALQEILQSYGFTVDTIKVGRRVYQPKKKNKNILNKIKRVKNKSLTDLFNLMLLKTWGKYKKNRFNKFEMMRTKSFKEFTQKYINETDYFISEENIPKNLVEEYDFFIVGSDQVWNPHFNLEKSIYFLNFVPKQKRLTYAPSFGVTELPEEYVDEYKKGLSGFNKLTIRERSGVVLIEKLTRKEVDILIDPTMLLDKEEWLKIAKEPKFKPSGRYILNYFLGKVKKEDNEIIKKISKVYKLKIIDMASMNDLQNHIIGPSEFISYINSAKIIFTDSFHGVIFSILFRKPFVVFDRNTESGYSMGTRFNTLLSIFDLENRRKENIKSIKEIMGIDYTNIPIILERERQKSYQYIKNSLKIKNY